MICIMYEYIYNGIWVAKYGRRKKLVEMNGNQENLGSSTISEAVPWLRNARAGSNPVPYPFYEKVGQKYLIHKGLFCILLIRWVNIRN